MERPESDRRRRVAERTYSEIVGPPAGPAVTMSVSRPALHGGSGRGIRHPLAATDERESPTSATARHPAAGRDTTASTSPIREGRPSAAAGPSAASPGG